MSVGCKEWAPVCDALLTGRQSLLLRKGGLAEGAGGFAFDHPEFYLFPTTFHPDPSKLVGPPPPALHQPQPGRHRLLARAVRHRVWRVGAWEQVERLAPFHILSEATLRERFAWEDGGSLHVALVRVHRLREVWEFADEPSFGGCRSWIELPEPPSTEAEPVLQDAEFAALETTLAGLLPGE